jgi:S1-C subfamily serine protease
MNRLRLRARWLAVVAVVVLAVTAPAADGEQPRSAIGGPTSLAPAAAAARAAVVTLKLPGRAVLYGLLADDWPDDEDIVEAPADQNGHAGELTLGSAVVIEASGIAVTTARLGRRALTLRAVTSDGRRVSAMVIGRDAETDVAVLALCCDARPFRTIALGDSDRLSPGDRVLVVGAPFGLDGTATATVISGRTTDEANELGTLLHTGPLTSGYVGGAVVDPRGAMVGLVIGSEGGAGTVLPSNTVRRVVSAILEEGRVRRGSLGIKGQSLDAELAAALGASAAHGVVVVDVRADGPAARAGVRTGDVVVDVDGRRVDTASRLARVIGAVPPGRAVGVTLWRRDRELVVTVRIDEEPDDDDVGSIHWRSQALFGADVAAITSDMGVVIADVDPGGPAERAGMRRFDVIREVNGRTIRSLREFEDALGTMTVEARVAVLLQRGAQTFYVVFRP